MPEAPQEPNISDANRHIEAMRARFHQWGNIDSENDDLNGILARLNAREITPQEAINEANELEDSRNLR